MSFRSWHPGAILASATLTLGLTSCSGASADSKELTEADSPLSKAMGFDGQQPSLQDQIDAEAQTRQQERRVEERVASCMAEQGFSYIPHLPVDVTVAPAEEDELSDPIENAHQNGYGITTGWVSLGMPEEAVDQNLAITESMSETELSAYSAALNGGSFEGDAEAYAQNWELQGCTGLARHEVYEVDGGIDAYMAVHDDPRWSDLRADMAQLNTTAQNDPRTKELQLRWSTCMFEAGLTFASPLEAWESVDTAVHSAVETSQGVGLQGLSDEDVASLREQEIDVAVADFTCREATDYENEFVRIQFAIEQEFVDANAAELKAFSAALEAVGR